MKQDDLAGLSKEQRILRVLRKVLANIVKDATPLPGRPHPLSEGTIAEIRDLFGLIAERERTRGRRRTERQRKADVSRSAASGQARGRDACAQETGRQPLIPGRLARPARCGQRKTIQVLVRKPAVQRVRQE